MKPTFSIADEFSSQDYPSNTLASFPAADLSFQKLSAGLDPLISRLRNLNLIKNISFFSGGGGANFIGSAPADSQDPCLFFGTITLTATHQPTKGGGYGSILHLSEKGVFTRTLLDLVTLPDTTLSRTVIANAIIEKFTFSSDFNVPPITNGGHVSIGVVIYLTRPVVVTEDFGPVTLPFEIVEDEDRPRNAPGVSRLDQWPPTYTPFSIPTAWKPKFSAPLSQSLPPIPWSNYGGTTSTVYPFQGTVIPRNFYNFLQYLYSKQNGGVPLTVAPTLQTVTFYLEGFITALVWAIRSGRITLGVNNSEFILPIFEFSSLASRAAEATDQTGFSAMFDWDIVDGKSVALWPNFFGADYIAESQPMIALFPPYRLSTNQIQSQPYQLVRLTLPSVSLLDTVSMVDISAPAGEYPTQTFLGSTPKNHSDGEYAFAFDYPTAPL